MKIEEIKKLIIKGEGISLEFKEAREALPESFFETVCAFLNRNGGSILLGVSDSGKCIGVSLGRVEAICKQLADISNNPSKITPAFLLHPEIIDYRDQKLISVLVPASSQVHRCNGKVFDRSVDGDFEVKADEAIKNIYLRKSSLYTETTIYPYLHESYFVDGIVDKVRKLIQINRPNHPWNMLSRQDFFSASGLYRTDAATGKSGFTLAALLLFGKEEAIQSALPHYKTDALLRRLDLERYDDRENIRCNLIEAYEKLMSFTAKHLPDKFYLEGDMRMSLREIIFREVISNFLIHREYTNAYPATFIIYKDVLEVKNANRPHFYGKLLPGKFEPFPKNPTLAKIFVQIARAEELGTGIRKVYKYIEAYSGGKGLEFLDGDQFTVRVPLNEREAPQVTPQVTPQVEAIVLALEGDSTRDELQSLLEIKDREYFRKSYLKPALEAGLIEMTIPEKPNSKNQRYRLTRVGLKLKLKKLSS